MKTQTNFTLIAIALFAMLSIQTACAQQKNISKNYNVSAFSAIDADIVGNIIFTQSTTSVSAEGEEEMVNNLIVKVENNTLKLSKKKNLKRLFGSRKAKRLVVKVSAPELYKIESDGVGNITLEGQVTTDRLNIESDGVGNITAMQLNCNRLTVDSDGVGNIRLKGKGEYADIKSDGVGNIDAQEFIADDAKVHSDGVGNVKCYASKNIELYGGGVGNITYYGKPNVKSLNKDGIGKIKAGN